MLNLYLSFAYTFEKSNSFVELSDSVRTKVILYRSIPSEGYDSITATSVPDKLDESISEVIVVPAEFVELTDALLIVRPYAIDPSSAVALVQIGKLKVYETPESFACSKIRPCPLKDAIIISPSYKLLFIHSPQ